jgi:hypothetical protein
MHAALDQFSRRYIDAAIANTIQRIASIPANQGKRNSTLNREVYSLARLIGSSLSAQEVREAGIKGATANGYLRDHGLRATLATISSAIHKGQQSPLTAKPKKYRGQK